MGEKKRKSKMFTVQSMKAIGGADVRFHSFLTSALGGSEC
jgi:hypothetical protein